MALASMIRNLKGGQTDRMETKSRYEVIADLEQRKRDIIVERDSLEVSLKRKERDLKSLKRDVEDQEDEVKVFKDSIKDQKVTMTELIKSIDESLNRFTKLNK